MRLINCSTLQLEDFFDSNIPDYAILSHCWGKDEVLFADLTLNLTLAKTKESWRKIDYTCKQAIQDGLHYAWVDTCCIDKTSSVELSEAINSMFRWYEGSKVCYVYLSDVFHTGFEIDFPASRWFTRGWTLQELLAPSHVIFYDHAWNPLGTRYNHATQISEITTIDRSVLLQSNNVLLQVQLSHFCVAKKMSWAAHRDTTRLEDAAYCLMGIFDINMPLLYGEGMKAFHRLQEEIIKVSNDDSILAWDLDTMLPHPQGLVPKHIQDYLEETTIAIGDYLAASPKNFANCGKLQFGDRSSCAFTTTNHGLQIQLPISRLRECPGRFNYALAWLGLLSCSTGSSTECLAIVLTQTKNRVDGSKKFKRLRLLEFPNERSTIIIGPKRALESEVEKIMISRIHGTYRTESNHSSYYHLLVTETYDTQKVGYHISNVTREHIHSPADSRMYRTAWDPAAMMFTTDCKYAHNGLISLAFSSTTSSGDRGFTLFLNIINLKAIALEGLAFSMQEKLKVFISLRNPRAKDWSVPIHEDDLNKCPFRTATGREMQVEYKVKKKDVYGWRIFDFKVDISSRESIENCEILEHAHLMEGFRTT